MVMIRNGRGLMPTYNRIEEMDRWDVVNYIRGLQGLAGHPVETGPLAPPGVTGKMVPGFTRMGPTRPAPFYNQWSGAEVPRAGYPATSRIRRRKPEGRGRGCWFRKTRRES